MLLLKRTLICACLLASFNGMAAGMVPDTSLLIVNEDKQGASMDVKNTDAEAQLLYTKIIDLPDDPKPGLIATQPVVRVDAGKTQRVRFVLKNSNEPLKVEHFKRVIFTAIPQREKNKVKVVFSQNLPVIIHPAGLAVNIEPWKALTWQIKNGNVTVENNTPYVVRLEQKVKLMASSTIATLAKTYILPGEKMTASAPAKISASEKQIEIYPATRYGYKAGNYIADLQQ
ncbi:fimbria/pilus chaperone family protein [Enterobacter hormaechei]|uniref:fimbria/pilus chaperone family protein n=1 Tax=Enterobacter hormaechei TaxID=158836 RepID=UPI00064A3C4E|nr:fimbria/pilus chaperone family protein [Enterobacter hormaechei]KLQ29267.1 molecular chaperone [Enterobacter hormaechei subsp. steigerwaltii]KZP77019.1 molecular chaperone [Enterobacter hormaechei subsp. steigerwaltii]MCC2017121.1 fimbria/pilus periplasmic chaperone [Enterobacter hormaechei]MDV5643834.1 fimbria/pilus chaperone family protein [Enterobacter hormaechei]